MTREIPERIEEILDSHEIVNMRTLDGWATGTVVEVDEDGTEQRRLDGAWIELFNGYGSAGVFGGVRLMWVDESVDYDEPWDDDGGYEERYAYATKAAAEAEGEPPYWYVAEYDQDEVDYGIPAP